MRVAVQRHEPRVRKERRELAPAREGNRSIGAAVQHERRCLDERQDVAHVGVEIELEEDRSRRGRCCAALLARVLGDLVTARMWIEQAGEHLRTERPVRADELDQRALRHLGDVVAVRVAAEVDELRDGRRAANRELRRRETGARRRDDDSRVADGVDHRLELA